MTRTTKSILAALAVGTCAAVSPPAPAPRAPSAAVSKHVPAGLVAAQRLQKIGFAYHAYADKHNQTPPAAWHSKRGERLLSWRVLILPQLGYADLHDKFDWDEPWDGPKNKKLLDQMPKEYAIPGQKAAAHETHFRAFVGNGAAFEWVTGMKFPASFPDGTANTIVCATAATAVPWTKPDELDYDPKRDPRPLIGAPGISAPLFLMASADVRAIHKPPVERWVLDLLIQRNDGRPVPNF
jgi:hypothetical protein